MRALLLPLLAALLLLVGAPRAQACSCLKERSELAWRLRGADVVFFGTIAQIRSDAAFHHLTVRVEHALKGVAASLTQMEIVTGIDSASCGVQVALGESYLWSPNRNFQVDRLGIDSCNATHLRMSPAEFEQRRAELEGFVAPELRDAGAEGGLVAPAARMPGSADEAEDGCALGHSRAASPAWLWLMLSALGLRFRSRSRRRRSPAPVL